MMHQNKFFFRERRKQGADVLLQECRREFQEIGTVARN